jgi:TPR repeat protein
LFATGDGVAMNKSLAAHDFKLSVEQGNACAQNGHAVCLENGDGVAMNKALAIY